MSRIQMSLSKIVKRPDGSVFYSESYTGLFVFPNFILFLIFVKI